MKHEFDNGKYAVEQTADYKLLAFRHGEPWQDLTGNNLVYWMLCEIDKLKGQRAELLEASKRLLSNKRGEDDWLILATHCHDLQEAIDRAEGAA